MQNRIYKFRAWDKKNKTMIISGISSLCVGNGNVVYIEYYPKEGGWDARKPYHFTNPEVDNLELMQFTGLLDKNGKEIYEGDILVSNPEVKCVVIWSDGNDSRTVGFFIHKLITNEYYPITRNQWDMEVIGNIYENPDLLNTEEQSTTSTEKV